MAYNSNDQRTVPGVLQGETAQKWAGPSMQANNGVIGNSGNPNPTQGNPNPEDASGRPGYLAVGQPGGNPSAVLVPGGQYSATDNNVLIVGAPAGLTGGGVASYYPGPVNAMLAPGWTSQQTDSANEEHGLTVAVSPVSPITQVHATAGTVTTASASGGVGSYTYSAPLGVPSGFTLTGGVLAQTVSSVAGTYSIYIEATDSVGAKGSVWVTVTLT